MYLNVRITPAILKNGTFILLHLKLPKHPNQNNTSRHHSRSGNVVSKTGIHENSLKEIIRIWKSYQNIIVTFAILRNDTFKMLKQRIRTETPQNYSKTTNLHCVKSVRIRSFSGLYFPVFRMGENTNQKNSEYRHFSRSVNLWNLKTLKVFERSWEK